jgi:methyltransferase (TIGR00027 family)
MAQPTVSRTALGAAICRTIEQYQPEETRLFSDPVVKELLGGSIRFMMQFTGMRKLTLRQTDAVAKGIYGVQVCRTRYIDDVVQSVMLQGIEQLAILGAGYDTRPYRLSGMKEISVFELDLPIVQEDKRKKLTKYLGRLPENVTYIPIDFDKQTVEEVFSASSFNVSKPTLFIWEGVTQYITEQSVGQTLTFVGKAATASSILFTYVLKSIIEHRSDIPDADRMLDVVAKQSPWIFGLEPSDIPDFLKLFHLSLIADAGSVEYQEKYLRPAGRKLDVFPGERIALATVR